MERMEQLFLYLSRKMAIIFVAGAAAITVLLLLGVLLMSFGGGSVHVPYDTVERFTVGDMPIEDGDSFEQFDIRREIEATYGDRVAVIAKRVPGGNVERVHEILIDRLLGIDESYRRTYINGLADVSEQAAKGEYSSQVGRFIDTYHNLFISEQMTIEQDAMATASTRMYLIGGVGATMFVFLMFTLILAILQVEHNTRELLKAKDTSAAPGHS